jgi:hypothetical protein
MAEKTIGLRIQLNGLNAVVKDIQTFETEIRKAKEDLKQVEIGSKVFNQLSQEIGLAESQLLGLITSTKRLTKEREIEGIGKLGQGIASSFAAATAAVSLFGVKDEGVMKAAADAQNLLTLALSARGIAEVKLGAQLVARTIAERAGAAANKLNLLTTVEQTVAVDVNTASQEANTVAEVQNTVATRLNSVATGISTAVTNGFNASLKALYATLAANPYTAIIAALGLLVSAYILLGNEEETETKKLKTFNEIREEGIGQVQTEITKIQILTAIIKDNTSSLLARQGAYEELKKLVPELANLTLEEAENQGLLNKAVEREIELIGLRAQQKAIENFMVQESEAALAKENKERKDKIEELKEESYWTNLVNGIRVFWLGKLPLANKNQAEINKLEAQGTAGKQDLFDITKRIATLQGEQKKTLDDTKKGTKDVTDAEEKRKKQQEELIKALTERLKIEAQLIAQTFAIQELDNKILKTTEANVKAAQDYANALNKTKSISELIIELNNQLKPSVDNVGEGFLKGQDYLESYFNKLKGGKLNAKESAKAYEELKNSLNGVKDSFTLTAEEEGILDSIRLNYRSIFDTINQFQNIKDVKPPFNAEDWEQGLIDYNLAIGKLVNDPTKVVDAVSGELRQRNAEELAEAKRTAAERFKILENSFVQSYVQVKKIEALKSGELNKSSKDYEENLKSFTAGASEAGKIAFANLQKTGEEVLKVEQAIFLTAKRVKSLNEELNSLAPAARRGFIVENAEQIAKEYDTVFIPMVLRKEKELKALQDKIRTKNFEEDVKYKDALILLETELKNQNIDISTLTYAEKLDLLEKFLNKEVEVTTKAEKTKQEKTKETLDKITKGIEQFSSFVGEASSLYQQKIAFDLDQLEKSSKKTLDQVIGDSEEANAKRLELTKQYETEKATLEKQALIKSLQAQKVQAIASLATALIQTYADFGFTPVGFIAAGIGTALAGYQVALIQDQINSAQSMAGGGMVFGPSHEMGGVMASGGYNLEGGESVINRVSTVKYGNLLSNINQMGGGKAMVNNTQNGLMEERLLQAIAKTNNEPIRAYVLNSDITSGQAINRRLNQLATL